MRHTVASGSMSFLRELHYLLSSTHLVIRTKKETANASASLQRDRTASLPHATRVNAMASTLPPSAPKLLRDMSEDPQPLAPGVHALVGATATVAPATVASTQHGSSEDSLAWAARQQQRQWEDVGWVLSLLQQLCEGHRRQWQDLLREQPGQVVTVNVVGAVAQLLGRLAVGVGPVWYVVCYWDAWYPDVTIVRVVHCVSQLFATLTETMQGPCPGNQTALSNGRLLDAVNWVWDAIETALRHRDRDKSNGYGSWGALQPGEDGSDASGSSGSPATSGGADNAQWESGGESDEHDELLAMPRFAVLLQLQHRILETLCAVLEGSDTSSNLVVHAVPRLVARLDLYRVPRLLRYLLPKACFHCVVDKRPCVLTVLTLGVCVCWWTGGGIQAPTLVAGRPAARHGNGAAEQRAVGRPPR